jgi:hypothetical protein
MKKFLVLTLAAAFTLAGAIGCTSTPSTSKTADSPKDSGGGKKDTPKDTGSKPGDTTIKPSDTGSKPGDTTIKPADTGAKPADTKK